MVRCNKEVRKKITVTYVEMDKNSKRGNKSTKGWPPWKQWCIDTGTDWNGVPVDFFRPQVSGTAVPVEKND